MGELLTRRRELILATGSEPIDVGNALTSNSTTAFYTASFPIYLLANTVVDVLCSFNWGTAGLGSSYVIAQFPMTGSYTVNGNIARESSNQNLRYNGGTTSNKWSSTSNFTGKTVVRFSFYQASKYMQVETSDGTTYNSSNQAGTTWPTRTVGLKLHLKENLYFKRLTQTTNGVVVHDCVPRSLNGVVGMLDLIDNVFYPVNNASAIITTI